ncbi:MAG: aminotransferase class I/II-fold pyridoxal phosphate-dependent enzyme [Candidatus Kerfeldbacteria bacterium]|nr:aminotransferase class I/II-fold pyridoxal phosphate-dependent enzyme [Candidatus Kerfeldbacteria bacterium]
MRTPISSNISPNVTKRDIQFVLSRIFYPWHWLRWMRGTAVFALEKRFKEDYGMPHAIAFDAGRTALYALMDALKLRPDDKVILQSFTCISVPNTIIAAGGKPRYVDIDDSYNIDVDSLETILRHEQHIRAVIVQHTFGIPADIERIQALCRLHGVLLIEDCAHALGAAVNGKLVGTFGDAAMFSFGRDKVISSVSGGLAITHNTDIAQGVRAYVDGLSLPSRLWVKKRLLHPLIFAVAKQFYYFFSLGKLLIEGTRSLHLWPLVLETEEKQGQQLHGFRLPNVIAEWALQQYSDLEIKNTHRKKLADMYQAAFAKQKEIQLPTIRESDEPIFLRFPIQVSPAQAEILLKKMRKEGILLGDWYRHVIDPKDASLTAAQYTNGSCPNAEETARRVVNLPTSIQTSKQQAENISQHIIQILHER